MSLANRKADIINMRILVNAKPVENIVEDETDKLVKIVNHKTARKTRNNLLIWFCISFKNLSKFQNVDWEQQTSS